MGFGTKKAGWDFPNSNTKMTKMGNLKVVHLVSLTSLFWNCWISEWEYCFWITVSRLKIDKHIAVREIPEILNINLGSQSKVKSNSSNRWGCHEGDNRDSPEIGELSNENIIFGSQSAD